MNYKYTFDIKKQLTYGIIGFVLPALIVYLFEGHWNWGIAIGVGLGNFIITGFIPKECK